MVSGLQMPHLSAFDPALAGEGTLDPLGTAPIAERLAEGIAPWVTARMSRIRFITAMSVAASVCEPYADRVAVDGVTSPYLAFEWLLIEALAKDRSLPASATQRVPGIDKARSAWTRKQHLDAMSYLKVPKVFGFHGVFKRLARALGVVDSDLYLATRGDELVRVWETEQGLPGFADNVRDSEGGRLRRRIAEQVWRALEEGRLTTKSGSWLWGQLVSYLRPDDAGRDERRLLWRWLTDEQEPLRRELLLLVRDRGNDEEPEWEVLRAVRHRSSPTLRERLDAIDRYERFAELLQAGFDSVRRASTAAGTRPIRLGDLEVHEGLREIAAQIPRTSNAVAQSLDPLGLGAEFDDAFGSFGRLTLPVPLVEALLERHEAVQAAKPPGGKRSWFDVYPDGLMVRAPYRVDAVHMPSGRYIHPYRVGALRWFIRDLM